MTSNVDFIGPRYTGIPSDSWYSIQAAASDYFLGINATPAAAGALTQLGGVSSTSLWQFVAAGPDTSQGIYALRSKTSQGLYCADGTSLKNCMTDAGRFQVYNSSTEGGGAIFVLEDQSALWVDGNSSIRDPVEAKTLNSGLGEGGYSWAIRKQDAIDAAAWPLTFTPRDRPSTKAMSTASTATSVQSAAACTITQITLTTTSMTIGIAAVTSSGTASSPQQTGLASQHTRVSTKTLLAGLACLSLLLSM